MAQSVVHAPIPIIHVPGFEVFSIVIYILSASVSLLIFCYGLILAALDPRIRHNHVVRIVLVVQMMNCLHFIFRLLASFITIRVEIGCRAMLFLYNALALLPVNLCVYCVLYLQITIIHKVNPRKRWPKAVILTFAVLTAVVPTSMDLYVPPTKVGLASYCKLPKIFNHDFFLYYNLTVALWQYLSGVVGVMSMTIIGVYIFRAERVPQSLLKTYTYSYEPARAVIQQSQKNILYHTLLSIIWFPITPIASLWFNLLLFSISYHTRRTYTWLEFINVVLLGLQSVLLGMGLVVNPAIRRAFMERIWRRRMRLDEKARARQIVVANEVKTERKPPSLRLSSTISLDSTVSDSISDV